MGISNLLMMVSIEMPISVRNALLATFITLMTVLSIALIVLVLMQKSTEGGLGALNGSANNYIGQGKGRTLESKLKLATLIVGVLLLVVSILYFICQ